MVRGQQLLEAGSVTVAFAPELYEPTPIYTNTSLPSSSPMLDRTNASNRFLATGSINLGDRLSPELLLYREGNQTRLGTNLAEGIGQKVVAYLEWSGGRRVSLMDDALRNGRDTGTLPSEAPSVIPESSHASFQSELAIGASYTTESRITFNLEYHFNQAGFARADWRNWFAVGGACLSNDRRSEGDPQRANFGDRFPRIAGLYVRETIAGRCRWGAAAVGEHYSDRLPGSPGGSPVVGELWYLRDYALDRQYPISRHSAFLRADWVDAFVPRLELTGFINADLYDGSALAQLTADYYLSDHWTVGGLMSATFGSARSDFGSLGSAASFMLKLARYF